MEQLENEIWKDIIGYEEKYKVSNLVRILSVNKYVKLGNTITKLNDKILKQYLGKRGYYTVNLYTNSKIKVHTIHRLIAIHFIENKDNKPHINHINGIKTDNSILNLEWISNRENSLHKHTNAITLSNYTGVYYEKKYNKYSVSIKINGKSKRLGSFVNENDAAMCYKNFVQSNNIDIKYARLI